MSGGNGMGRDRTMDRDKMSGGNGMGRDREMDRDKMSGDSMMGGEGRERQGGMEHNGMNQKRMGRDGMDQDRMTNSSGMDRGHEMNDGSRGNGMSEMFSSEESRRRFSNREFEDLEPAFRYGHAARQNFGDQYPRWNDSLSSELRDSYEGNWQDDEPLIRYSYEYNYMPVS